MALALTFGDAIKRAADILVYSSAEISARTLADWRSELGRANNTAEMLDIARRHLRASMRLPIEPTLAAADTNVLALRCASSAEGWTARLAGFENAPPGARRVAVVYADLLAQSLDELERRNTQVERERLAELGMLAATIAHDLRNPLNILNMAVADAPEETRREVSEQTRRMNRLVADLLDYAKPWRIEPADVDLREILANVAQAHIDEGVRLRADPRRVEQALDNLLANARAAGDRVAVFVERDADATLIHVCDDGAGVPGDIKDRLFEPFVSRASEGTGSASPSSPRSWPRIRARCR